MSRLRREIRHAIKWRKEPRVAKVVSPNPAPERTLERLRRRVLSGDWTGEQP